MSHYDINDNMEQKKKMCTLNSNQVGSSNYRGLNISVSLSTISIFRLPLTKKQRRNI